MLLNRLTGRRIIRRRWLFVAFLVTVFVASCSSWASAQAAPLEQAGCSTSTSGSGIIMPGVCPSFTWIRAAEKQPEPYEEVEQESYDPVTAPPYDPNGHWTMSGEPRSQKARSMLIMARVLFGLAAMVQNFYDFSVPPPCQSNIEGAPGLVICSNGIFKEGHPYNPEGE